MLCSEHILLVFVNEKFARKYDLLKFRIHSMHSNQLTAISLFFKIPIYPIDKIENHLTDNLLSVYIAETLD